MIALRPLAVLIAVLLAGATGCSDAVVEERAREAARKVQESFGEQQAAALAQTATEADIQLAQAALTRLKEYQGEVNGKLDAVTINAIAAFQRSQGLEDDGILDARTLALLRQQR
ncbi:MAG TPA: peptidoglycan-binding domain-containing protein [Terriglobales bacterium]|nr:peptidoglycan-binding domain-containing protein [Terriglobales bacterium]